MSYVAQEGGDHYQAEYQHWDWVTDIGMGYLPGNATKYVCRWRKKNGVADLKKAMTYVDKMIACLEADPEVRLSSPVGNGYKIRKCTDRFVEVNKLEELETSFCYYMIGSCDNIYMMRTARNLLSRIIRAAGQGQAAAAPTLAATPGEGPTAPADGRFLANTGQAIGHRASVDGMEHPFGYDDRNENGFDSVNRTKTDEGYNG